MSVAPVLHWLPEAHDWKAQLRRLNDEKNPARWDEAVVLANSRLDFVRTNMLDSSVRRAFGEGPPTGIVGVPVRLAMLGSSTIAHLHSGIRVAALRRGLHVSTYESDFGQYRQELADVGSGLHAFQSTAVLFIFDAWHVTAGVDPGLSARDAQDLQDEVRRQITGNWRLAREHFRGPILQQTILPVFGALMGNNEQRLPGSRAGFVRRLNDWMREVAGDEGVDLIALDQQAAMNGLDAWHDIGLWRRSKQEVSPAAAPMYGDLVARVLAALQGRSYKCLVLDLDNTLWGGVIGDDGLEGLVLGQGSPEGEAFLAVQEFARDLARRGVILAVCSKNDEANAFEAFDRHPEMILKRDDISCFVANWEDKATNLRRIASQLNIGIDSLVFLDDNPVERGLIRSELSTVAVPELSEDPAHYPRAVTDAGYFEALQITGEDRERSRQYRGNKARDSAKVEATDMASYLSGLEMRLIWRRFDRAGLPRVTQLINKTNQFNLTTRRYTDEQVAAVMADPAALGLQLRLVDRFGDNGVVAIVIGRLRGDDLDIDTWLMSCRVLGRQVEAATLNVLAQEARAIGSRRLVGEFRPTAKNAMVRDHYAALGFDQVESEDGAGGTVSALDLDAFSALPAPISIEEGQPS